LQKIKVVIVRTSPGKYISTVKESSKRISEGRKDRRKY
jgi:hypothetical protein